MHRSLRRILALGGAAAIATALTAPLASATVSAASVSHTFNKAVAARFLRHMDRMLLAHSLKAGAISSSNWSGYADVDSTFSQVQGSWIEPAITCKAKDAGYQLAAFWVGIDGFSDSTVEQDGTIAECYGGTYVGSYDWWEMYPTNSVQIEDTIEMGDQITASVSINSSDDYVLAVTDVSTTASFTTTQACGTTACEDSSAEWIAEAPCCNGELMYDLAHFKPITFTKASVTGSAGLGTISSYTWDSITMVGDVTGNVIAKPSSLNSAGDSFKVKWRGQD